MSIHAVNTIILYKMHLVSAPSGVVLNSQFFRPITKGFTMRSAMELFSSSLPSKKTFRTFPSWART